MAYEIDWVDSAVCEINETAEEPDGKHLFATWAQAKQTALESAMDNREQWAACVRSIRAMRKADSA